MFPITLVLPRSKVQDGVLAGVLAITAAGTSNHGTGKGVKGLAQSVSLFPLLPRSQYYRDAKPLLPIEYLVTPSLATVGIQKN